MSKHHTSWAGVFATGAELSRRRYAVAVTIGNTPSMDLLCVSPEGRPFKVEVKSAATPNYVPIQKWILEGDLQHDLVFVIVYVHPDTTIPFQFFLLTHQEVKDAWDAMPKTKPSGEPYKPGWEGLKWKDVMPHEGRWDKLPR